MTEAWREVSAEWTGGSSFTGKGSNGKTIEMGPLNEMGASPMELLLLGLAGCTGMDIVSILEKKRQDVQKFEIQVRAKRAEDYPMIWTEIEVTYLLWGKEIDPKAVEQAVQLSEEKYCSVGIMLQATAQIRSSYRIFSAEENALAGAQG